MRRRNTHQSKTHTSVPEEAVVVVRDFVVRWVVTEVVVTVVCAFMGATRAMRATMHAKSIMRFLDAIVVFIECRWLLWW